MQKKIIALAVAGLVSGAAFAQSNVTVYGVADIGYVYDSDSYTANAKSKSQIYAGGQNGSRFGFRGEEDLGNGLKANFRMEAGVQLDTGYSDQATAAQLAADQNGILFGRWATVGLSGTTWGAVEGGRRDTFIDQAVAGANVMKGNATVGQVTPIFQRVQRYDNFVAYTSPSFSGLQLKAGFSSNAAGQDKTPTANTTSGVQTTANTNLRVYAAGATYTNGGLFVAATYDYSNYQNVDHPSNVNDLDSGNAFYLVGSYDFGVARVNAGYGKINYSQNLQTKLAADTDAARAARALKDRDQWQLGVSVPFSSADSVALNYAHGKNSYDGSVNFGDESSSIWGVAYFHDLSKRTNVYVAYGDINQSENNKLKFSIDGGANATYQKAFQFGMKHSF